MAELPTLAPVDPGGFGCARGGDVSRVRGRAPDVRGAPRGGGGAGVGAGGPLRGAQGGPRSGRHAQPPRVGRRLLGRGGPRRDRRPAERLVDRSRARVRARGLRHQSGGRRSGASGTDRAPPRRPAPWRARAGRGRPRRRRTRKSRAVGDRSIRGRPRRRPPARRLDGRGSRPPTGGGLAGGRRHDLLYLGDDGQAEGGARDPAQHLHEPHEPRLRQRPQRPAVDGGRAGRAPGGAGSELLAALGSAFPRHRLPLGSRAEHRRRRQARDDAPLEPRAALWS